MCQTGGEEEGGDRRAEESGGTRERSTSKGEKEEGGGTGTFYGLLQLSVRKT